MCIRDRIRDRKEHVFIIFWGEHGRNGKDTLIKLVTHVLGMALSGDVQVEMFLRSNRRRTVLLLPRTCWPCEA